MSEGKVNASVLRRFIRTGLESDKNRSWKMRCHEYIGSFERRGDDVRFWFYKDGACVAYGNTADNRFVLEPRAEKNFAKAFYSYVTAKNCSVFTPDCEELKFPCVFEVKVDDDLNRKASDYFEDRRHCILIGNIEEYADFLGAVEWVDNPGVTFKGYGNDDIPDEVIVSYNMLGSEEFELAEGRRGLTKPSLDVVIKGIQDDKEGFAMDRFADRQTMENGEACR